MVPGEGCRSTTRNGAWSSEALACAWSEAALPPRATAARPLGARVLGQPSAPHTVVLIGGIAQIAASWTAVAHMLHEATGARVVLPDNPGIAQSRNVPVPRDCSGHARLHAETLASLGIDGPVHVVGLSLGSMIAAELAAQLGSRARSLTLCAGSSRESGWFRLAPAALLRMTCRALVGKSGLQGRLPELVQPSVLRAMPDLVTLMHTLRRQEGGFARGALVRQLLAASRFRLVPLIPKLPALRMVVVGTGDLLVSPVHSRRMAAMLACPLHELEGHGHYLALDGAEKLAAVLQRLVQVE